MNKDEFNKVYQKYAITKEAEKNPVDSDVRIGLEQILKEDKPELASVRNMPADGFHALARDLSKDYQLGLVDYVNANLNEFVDEAVNEKNALPIVLSFKPYLDNDIAKLVKEIQDGMELLRKADEDPKAIGVMTNEIIELYGSLKNSILYNATSSDPKWVINTFAGLVGRKQDHLTKKLDNIDAMKRYVAENLRAVPDKEKVQTYTGFANMVANTYQAQEAAKKEK